MTPQHWQQVKHIFQSALQYPPDKRAAFLYEACASDPSLRSEVASLISSHNQAGDTLEAMAGGVAAQMFGCEPGNSLIGTNIGPYKILSEIGRGGMGNVFLAHDPRLDRRVALKLLPGEFAQNQDRLRRFQREARAVSALNHPNILTIHEVGQIHSLNFIVAEFIEGETLRNRMCREGLIVREALDIAIQIASALATAHKAGIVHRDVKPENIMLREDGIVKVLDFGLAKLTQRHSSINDTEAPTLANLTTDPGAMMGTVNYMSPEQVRGLDVDERTDIFSLGVLTYELITGERPFEGDTTSDVIVSLLTKEPASIASGTEVPADLERMVGKCLEKSPENRYQSAQEVLDDLEHLRRDIDSGVAVKLAESGGRTKRVFISRRLLLLLTLAALIGPMFIYLVGVWLAQVGSAEEAKAVNEAVESIAVLPFVSAGDPATENLGHDFTRSLIRSLGNIPHLRVIRAHRSKADGVVDLQALGRELSVRVVLTGRIIQQGNDLSIAVELMDSRDDKKLWDKHYTCALTDMLSVQREISREIPAIMRLRLTGEQQQRVANSYTENAEPYQLYLTGSHFLDRNDEASIQRAREYFQQAIDKDPGCALAYTGLADTYTNNPDEAKAAQAKAAVMKALEIDNLLGEAHISLAGILWHRDWDFAGAEREFEQGIRLNPSYATAHHEYSHLLMTLGRADEALAESQHYLELDPLSPAANVHFGWYYLMVRQYDQAIYWEQKALAMDTNFRNARFQLGEAYYFKGMYDEAVEEYLNASVLSGASRGLIALMREAYKRAGIRGFLKKWLNEEKQSEHRLIPYFPRSQLIAKLYGRLGAQEQALEWLERSLEKRDMSVDHFSEPELDNLRSEPRFIALLRRIGLRL